MVRNDVFDGVYFGAVLSAVALGYSVFNHPFANSFPYILGAFCFGAVSNFAIKESLDGPRKRVKGACGRTRIPIEELL